MYYSDTIISDVKRLFPHNFELQNLASKGKIKLRRELEKECDKIKITADEVVKAKYFSQLKDVAQRKLEIQKLLLDVSSEISQSNIN